MPSFESFLRFLNFSDAKFQDLSDLKAKFDSKMESIHIPDFRKAAGRWRGRRKARRELKATPNDQSYYSLGWRKLDEQKWRDSDPGPASSGKLWIGKDYVNFIFKNFVDLDKPDDDFIDREETPRMPWHDIHSVLYGTPARDVARHFIQRWNAHKSEKKKLMKDIKYPLLIPKMTRWEVPRFFKAMAQPCKVQVLRSISSWSIPTLIRTEASIHQAYIKLIASAKRFIYIENQFFVSLLNSEMVENKVCQALCDRIEKAKRNDETFRVYIVIPLLPNFQGELGTESGSSLQAVMKWTYSSISRPPHSLIHSLITRGVVNYQQYVSFCGLRTFDDLLGNPVSELIYIHSKLLIVDDTHCIIGTANINDRSLLGTRDSEIAVYIEDTQFSTEILNGKECKVGRYCGALRRHIFMEHLGCLPEQGYSKEEGEVPIDVRDPLSDDFYMRTWLRIASKNTDIFEKVFRCLPTDEVPSFEDLPAYQTQVPLADLDPTVAFRSLQGVQGHLVLFPTRFLQRSDLTPELTSKERLVPHIVFT